MQGIRGARLIKVVVPHPRRGAMCVPRASNNTEYNKIKACEIFLEKPRKMTKKFKGASTKAMNDFLCAVLSESCNLARFGEAN